MDYNYKLLPAEVVSVYNNLIIDAKLDNDQIEPASMRSNNDVFSVITIVFYAFIILRNSTFMSVALRMISCRSSIFTRSCSMVSRKRMVTQLSSSVS